MTAKGRAGLTAVVVLNMCIAVVAQPPWEKRTGPYSWKREAETYGLSTNAVATLEEHRLLIGTETFKQIFTPYLSERHSYFIKSDSLLNGYHVLFEESVLRLEERNARLLPKLLTFIWNRLKGVLATVENRDLQTVAGATTRARAIVGTALFLLDGECGIEVDEEIARIVAQEVKRIEEGKASPKPEWLGSPDLGFVELDYARYRPRGERHD